MRICLINTSKEIRQEIDFLWDTDMIGIYDCFGYGLGYDVSFEERYRLIKKAGLYYRKYSCAGS